MNSEGMYRMADNRDHGRFARFSNSAIDEPVFGVFLGKSEKVQGFVCGMDDGSSRVFSCAEVPLQDQW